MQLAFAAGGIALGAGAAALLPGGSALLGAQLGFLGSQILYGILFPNEIQVGGATRDDVRLSSGATGRFIPQPIVGSNKIGGQYRWTDEPEFIDRTETVGGKGGGGGAEVTSTDLYLTWNVGVCEAPVGGVDAIIKIWLDDDLIFDISDTNLSGPALDPRLVELLSVTSNLATQILPESSAVFEDGQQNIQVQGFGPIRIYLGGEGQPEEPLMQTDPRITEALGSDAVDWVSPAHGLCHVTFKRFPGEVINNHYPQCTFEVLVAGTPAMQGEHYEPVPKTSLLHVLSDRQTIVALQGQINLNNYIASWSLVEKNPTTPQKVFFSESTTRDIVNHYNIGTWDDPELNFFAITGAGNSTWFQYKGSTGAAVGAGGTFDLAAVQPIGLYLWPDTRSPSHVVGVAQTTNQIFSFPMQSDLYPITDLNDVGGIVGPVPVNDLDPPITSLSLHIDPGFVGPDGLVYIAAGETSGSQYAIIALDAGTLNVERAFYPYRESPITDDDLYNGFKMTYDPQLDKIWCFGAGTIRRVDRATFTIESQDIVATGIANGQDDLRAALMHGPVNGRIWLQRGTLGNTYSEYDLINMELVRTIDVDDWGVEESEAEGGFYDPLNHGIWTQAFFDADVLQFLPLDRRGPNCGTAQEIADWVSDRVGIPSSLRATGGWASKTICGYMSGRHTTGRKLLDPIAGLIGGDFRTQDAIVDFFLHSDGAVASISEDDLGVIDTRDQQGSRRAIVWPYERSMPQRVDMNWIDRQQNHNPNVVFADRPWDGFAGRDRHEIQMPVVFDTNSDPQPQEAVDRMLFEHTTKKEDHTSLLAWKYLGLNVGDLYTYTKGGRTHSVRIEQFSLTESNRIIVQGSSEDITLHTPSSVNVVPQLPIFEQPDLTGPGRVEGFLFDVSLLRDQDETQTSLLFYAGLTGANLNGARLVRSTDGGASWQVLATFTGDPSLAWGTAPTALPQGRHGVIDRDTSFTINMVRGTLPGSVSEADLHNDRQLHALAYGADGRWEIMRYSTLIDTTGSPDEPQGEVYTISGLRRGQSNTRHNQGSHQSNDRVILLDPAKMKRINLALEDLSTEFLYKIVPVGRSVELTPTISFTLNAEAHKPAPLSHVTGSRDIATGNWSIDAIRGGRIGYQWVDYVTTPLTEQFEEYELDVLWGAGGAVAFTIADITSWPHVITEAEFIAAGLSTESPNADGTSPFTIYVKPYQLSAVVGRGHTEEHCLTSPSPGSL
jgi:hypothetical protein